MNEQQQFLFNLLFPIISIKNASLEESIISEKLSYNQAEKKIEINDLTISTFNVKSEHANEVITSNISFHDSVVHYFSIEGTFKGEIFFESTAIYKINLKSTYIKSIRIENANIHELNIKLIDSSIYLLQIAQLSYRDNQHGNELFIQGELGNNCKINNLLLSNVETHRTNIWNLNVNNIDVALLFSNIIELMNLNISYLGFVGISVQQEIKLQNCNQKKGAFFVNTFAKYLLQSGKFLKYYTYLNKIQFRNCDFGSKLKIEDSDLRNFYLWLQNSNIREAKVNNSFLPLNVLSKKSNGKIDYSNKRETILQLKSLANTYSDSYTLMLIKILEQKVNYRLIKWKTSFSSKLVGTLNYISNNFGAYWLLPIIEYFSIGYLLYIWIQKTNHLDYSWNTYFNFLNPTHSLEIFCKDLASLHEGTGGIDFFAKIMFVYLSVQTVTAFRKYIKL